MDFRSEIMKYELKKYLAEKREEQRALEERYNHYHYPAGSSRGGQFASAKANGGIGYGLFYSNGKGKGGEVVGASSNITTHEINYPQPLTTSETNDKMDTSTGVKSCNSFDEVSEYMKNTYGISVYADVNGLDFETVKEGLSGFEAVAKDYPEIAKDLSVIRVDPRDDEAYAATDGRSLFLGSLDFGDPNKMKEDLARDSESGYFAAGNGMTAKDIICHEAGHMVAKAIVERQYSNDSWGHMDSNSDWKNGDTAKKIFNNAYDSIKKDPQFKGMKKHDIIKSMSGYAADYHPGKPRTVHNEAIAEAFSDVYKNGTNAHALSLAIVNEVNKLREGAKW